MIQFNNSKATIKIEATKVQSFQKAAKATSYFKKFSAGRWC
jgi:hypothetical protein